MEQNRPLGWTTLEEAKKLVAAGLDPNTADMYYSAFITYADGKPEKKPHYGISAEKYTERSSMTCGFTKVDYVPCWSLGALKKLMPDVIKKGNVEFFLHCAYDSVSWYAACYEDKMFNRTILFNRYPLEIEMCVNMFCCLLEDGYIKKSE